MEIDIFLALRRILCTILSHMSSSTSSSSLGVQAGAWTWCLAFVGEFTAFQLQGKSKDVTEQMTVIPSERLLSYSIKYPKINYIFHSQLKAECARTLGLL